MWFTINGFDVTGYPGSSYAVRSGDNGSEWPTFEQSINDPPSNLSLQVVDRQATLALDTGYEVIVWDDQAQPTRTFSGQSIPTTPAINIALNPLMNNDGTNPPANWTAGVAILPPTLWTYPIQNCVVTFNNNAVGSTYQSQNSLLNYVKVGQQYMFSVYMKGSGTILNIQYLVQIAWLDINLNVLSSISTVGVPTSGTQQHINVSGVAPANAAYAQMIFGGQTTVAGTNSGAIIYSSAQLEPMWFTNQGVNYPTPDCNFSQVNSAMMPDGTTSRACRLFSGYVDDLIWTWQGTTRNWTVSVASAGSMLENGPEINMNVTNLYDDQIISNIISTYFSGSLSIAAPNSSSANPVVRGINVPSDSYSDKKFRDVLNILAAVSGYNFYVDAYYTLHYNPAFYAAASFSLSDQPDNITSFGYQDYSFEKDATQRQRNIVVLGGKFIAPPITETFTGDGVTKRWTLQHPPYQVQSVTVAGAAQRVGINGVNNYTQAYDALADKGNAFIDKHNAPASGASVAVTYTYEAPVAVQVIDQDTSNPVPSPSYAIPQYYGKVHDTSLTDLAGATQRGLAELSKFSKPRQIIKLKAFKYIQPGLIAYFTSHQDHIINQPYITQKCTAHYLGVGLNEYEYEIGAYIETISDHIRHAHQAHQVSNTTANVTTPVQFDIVFSDAVAYSEQPVTYTVSAYAPPYKYNQAGAVYGYSSYS